MAIEPPLVKVCGLTSPDEAAACAALGAWAVGVVFAPESRRRVDAERASAVLGALPPLMVRVGVFVDAEPGELAALAGRCGLTHVQVHGTDPAEARAATGLPVIEGVAVDGPAALERARASAADLVLLDASVPGRHGGTGTAFDWSLLDEPLGRPYALAGGLTPENVADAVSRARPDIVDVSSGVESAPGRKDPALVRLFMRGVDLGRENGVVSELATRFGAYGGRFVPETVIGALDELAEAYERHRDDASFRAELDGLLAAYVGRPTPLYRARALERAYGIGALYLKREDLCHTGAHKINNALGQVLLARRMGKGRIIAETGAGQHGVATATAAALLGFECCVYMGRVDMARQRLNVIRMRMLGAEVRPVDSGSGTLKDATSEAIRDWVTNVRSTHYVIGSAVGPAPYPEIVAQLQSVIGREARAQHLAETGRLPAAVVACVGGGSNAVGIFRAFLADAEVQLVGVEAGGEGIASGHHGASLGHGTPGVLHGSYSYLLQDPDGQVAEAHSISAGLDYPGVGPEHSHLRDTGRVRYASVTDEEALAAFALCARREGIIPALEDAHALAHLAHDGPRLGAGGPVLVCLSGRGDKDVDAAGAALGVG